MTVTQTSPEKQVVNLWLGDENYLILTCFFADSVLDVDWSGADLLWAGLKLGLKLNLYSDNQALYDRK